MGSPGSEDRTYILSITIQDGKAFGPDLQAVACAATFAGETKLTPYSVGRDTHVWNTTLKWRITMDQFRRLTSLGQKDCKVVLSNKDGTKLGWFLVDVRAAKLQAQYKKTEGVWVNLTGAKKGDTPQICVLSLFYEDRPGVSFSPEPKQSPSKSRAASTVAARRQQATNQPNAASGDAQPDRDLSGTQGSPPEGGTTGAAGRGAATAAVGLPPAQSRNPTAGLANFGSPSRDPADDGPFRRFSLTIDVRSFQSSKRLPLSSANVYVQAVLPAELIELVVTSGHRLPTRLAPLCSHPAVDIPRGAEGAIPNGYGTLEFSSGLVRLARALAREPRISVEAWHKERFRTDMLLGAGSVPLTPLLQGAWVDGYAPLFAWVTSSIAGEVREERVQMGLLRVVLSLEDKGPAPPPAGPDSENVSLIPPAQAAPGDGDAADPPLSLPTATAAAAQPPGVLRPRPQPYHPGESAAAAAAVRTEPAGGDGVQGSAAAAAPLSGQTWEGDELRIREMHPGPSTERAALPASAGFVPQSDIQGQPSQADLPKPYSRAAPPAMSLGSPPLLARGAPVAAGPGARSALPPGVVGVAAAPEFEAAWELEVWKKAEEARWRAELREREAQRMLVLESEWRRRERAREAEIAGLKAECLALEDKAQQALAAAEGRERRILVAEEALLRRRKELEREHAARMVEAEAAVRRLQVECEHQLDIEKDRNAELVRRVAALEERLGASEMRCLTVENEFADFRAAARSTPEAELARQLAEAREGVKAAEARAAKAAKAKQGYKEQVRKLVDQMATLQRRRHHHGSDLSDGVATLPIPGAIGAFIGPPSGTDTSAIRAAAEEQARYAASQRQELAAMRAQLQAIKAAALAQLSPAGSPRGPAGGSGDPAVKTAAAVADVADLRSSDQQRSDRAERRSLSIGVAPAKAGTLHASATADVLHGSGIDQGSSTYAPVTGAPDDTPMSRYPGGPQTHDNNGSSATTTPADGNSSTSSSSDSRKPQQLRGGAVGAVGSSAAAAGAGTEARVPSSLPTRIDDAAGGYGDVGGASGLPTRQRWGEPRAAASAPPPPSAPTPMLGQGSSEKAASVPPPARTVSTSTSMTRTTAAAVAAAAAAPQAPQYQQLRRGWAPADWQQREQARWREPTAHGNGEDGDGRSDGDNDGDSHWDDPGDQDVNARNQSQKHIRYLQSGLDAAATAVAIVTQDVDDRRSDGADGAQRRSLADHLANASSAATRLRELQLDQGQRGGGGLDVVSPSSEPPGHGPRRPVTAARAAWQVPPPPHPHQHQQRPLQEPPGGAVRPEYTHKDNGHGGYDGGEGGSRNGDGYDYGPGAGNDPAGTDASTGFGSQDADLEEVQRLTRRQMELLQQGHDPDDPVVVSLDERIQALIAAASGGPYVGR
ncbi:hypothetical protein VaNZ11_015526 [Volvox africanus]|uniref:C2 domain-containing protein n=1 Tax=Volvox africanus TaxID=51714 RepID=A0ABQ5SN91_9CHLO|nr:hypothetical protein VaNZ11_015526 [Volvox africanus]